MFLSSLAHNFITVLNIHINDCILLDQAFQGVYKEQTQNQIQKKIKYTLKLLNSEVNSVSLSG